MQSRSSRRFAVRARWLGVGALSLLALSLEAASSPDRGAGRHCVLIVWDGMRPDFVSPALTPTLWSLRTNGVWFARHRASFPSSTVANGVVLATGVHPQRSGIFGNREYRPAITRAGGLGMAWLPVVRRGDEVSGGKYLAVATVAEIARAAGQATAVSGAKPVALLHDRHPRSGDAADPVWFAQGTLPESLLPQLTQRLGALSSADASYAARDRWTERCLTEAFWERGVPRYSLLWLSEPDLSQHEHGPGSAEALAAIRACDQRLAAVLAALDRRGVRAQTDLLVVSDHGFSTIGANVDVAAALRAGGINARANWTEPPAPGDIVVVGNGGSVFLYVIGRAPERVGDVARVLQRQPFAGVLFTRDPLPGTFPLSEIMLAGPDAPDLVLATRWARPTATNAHPVSLIFNDGYPEFDAGCGMHVTLCPTDLQAIAIASGPSFQRGVVSDLPSGNVDLAPTLLWLLGLDAPQPPDGRILREALVSQTAPALSAKPGRRVALVDLGDGVWEQYLQFNEVGGVRYLDEGNGAWSPAPSTPAAPSK